MKRSTRFISICCHSHCEYRTIANIDTIAADVAAVGANVGADLGSGIAADVVANVPLLLLSEIAGAVLCALTKT